MAKYSYFFFDRSFIVVGKSRFVCVAIGPFRSIKVGRPTALGGQQPLATAATAVSLVSSAAKPGGLNAAEAGQMAAAMLLGRADGSAGYDAQNRVYVGSVPYTFTAEDIKVTLLDQI